MTTVNKQSR